MFFGITHNILRWHTVIYYYEKNIMDNHEAIKSVCYSPAVFI